MKAGKRWLAAGMAVLMAAGLLACGGGSGDGDGTGGKKGSVEVKFMYGGDVVMAEMYNLLIQEFNNTVGAEQGVKVKGVPKSGEIDTVLAQQLPSNSGPDVVAVDDRYFKKYTPYMEELTGKVDQSVLDNLYPNMVSRYYYNIEDTTSNSDDPLYGVPVYSDPSVIFYNKTALEAAGVICISVAKEDLDAFNAGTGKDRNGKTKADYGIDSDIPAKGFYRSIAPFVPEPGETDGSSWTAPVSGEELVFNDQIAMNWDEVEDLGMICTKENNPSATTKYGYYTEKWFNYGWSVGGDCIEDLTGNGDWCFSLAGDTPNYIVGEGKTYTGVFTGTVYEGGDTLDIKDVLNAASGDIISYETDGATYFYYTVNGQEADIRDLSAETAGGTLTELPSIREAFSRFCYLAAEGGLNICPYPNAFSGTSSVTYFTSGNLALLRETVSNTVTLEKTMSDEWGIAPTLVYREYTDPTDPQCDTVARAGRAASHSDSYAVCISAKSEVKDQALVFVNWVATEGQTVLAENGYLSSQKSDAELVLEKFTGVNAQVVLDSLIASYPGDWWYMPDRSWIETWSTPLNYQVRYGTMSLEDFLYAYIEKTNERLAEYKE